MRQPIKRGEHPTAELMAKELERSELWGQLANAITLRGGQDQILWTVFGTFWATNAILLVALFSTGKFPDDKRVVLVVVLMGIAMSFVWLGLHGRALGNLKRYEELIHLLELRLQIPSDLASSGWINTQSYSAHLGRTYRARSIMNFCCFASALLWLIAFIAVFGH